jgi:hypothetical protein
MKYWVVASDALEKYISCGEQLREAILGRRYREAIDLFRQRDVEFLDYRAYVHLAERLESEGTPPVGYTRLVEQAADQNESLRNLCANFIKNLSDDQKRLIKTHQSMRAHEDLDHIGHFSKVVN